MGARWAPWVSQYETCSPICAAAPESYDQQEHAHTCWSGRWAGRAFAPWRDVSTLPEPW